jgi:poly-gamma-glutamate synthesis protein (capsule biosynthesis protein)
MQAAESGLPPVQLPTLSLQSIFSGQPPTFIGFDQRKVTTLAAMGDVVPAQGVNAQMVQHHSFTAPFAPTAPYTSRADLVVADLGTALFDACIPSYADNAYCAEPGVIQGLKIAGVNAVNLATSRIGSYGSWGVQQTESNLEAAHLAWYGLGHALYRQVHGITFAFLGFNGINETIDTVAMQQAIQEARQRASVIVVSFQWGDPSSLVPRTAPGTADQDPRTLAHAAVDAGATLVLGNYPVKAQGVEIYHGALIVYSHGSFLTDQAADPQANQGVVGLYTFYGTQLVAAHFRAVGIGANNQPRFVKAAVEAPILGAMRASSLAIRKGY